MATIKKPNKTKKRIARTPALTFKHGSAGIFSFFEPTEPSYPSRGTQRASVALAWKSIGDELRQAMHKVDIIIAKNISDE